MPDKELNKMTDNSLRACRFLNIAFYSSSIFTILQNYAGCFEKIVNYSPYNFNASQSYNFRPQFLWSGEKYLFFG
jgi:hypothetical protein